MTVTSSQPLHTVYLWLLLNITTRATSLLPCVLRAWLVVEPAEGLRVTRPVPRVPRTSVPSTLRHGSLAVTHCKQIITSSSKLARIKKHYRLWGSWSVDRAANGAQLLPREGRREVLPPPPEPAERQMESVFHGETYFQCLHCPVLSALLFRSAAEIIFQLLIYFSQNIPNVCLTMHFLLL